MAFQYFRCSPTNFLHFFHYRPHYICQRKTCFPAPPPHSTSTWPHCNKCHNHEQMSNKPHADGRKNSPLRLSECRTSLEGYSLMPTHINSLAVQDTQPSCKARTPSSILKYPMRCPTQERMRSHYSHTTNKGLHGLHTASMLLASFHIMFYSGFSIVMLGGQCMGDVGKGGRGCSTAHLRSPEKNKLATTLRGFCRHRHGSARPLFPGGTSSSPGLGLGTWPELRRLG